MSTNLNLHRLLGVPDPIRLRCPKCTEYCELYTNDVPLGRGAQPVDDGTWKLGFECEPCDHLWMELFDVTVKRRWREEERREHTEFWDAYEAGAINPFIKREGGPPLREECSSDDDATYHARCGNAWCPECGARIVGSKREYLLDAIECLCCGQVVDLLVREPSRSES